MSRQRKSNALLLDAGEKLKDAAGSVALDESLVSLLALRDRFSTSRELDGCVI